jgi:aspartyl-tRNA(Asn)/glutamyl-tRNA(Gln) amidotransferase subunit C
VTKLSISDIEHIAKLANLTLSKKEAEKFKIQLEKVINYINELSEVETSMTLPTSQTTGLENVTRKDKLEKSLDKELTLSGTDKIYNDYFEVPIILEEKSDI